MAAQLPAIAIMLLSAVMYSLSYVLQHKGTQASIGEHAGADAGVGKLLRNPIWIIGVVLFGLSFLLHMAALAFGSVAVVQPLIVTELIFIPPLAALISKARVGARDWVAIIVLAAALGGFLVIAAPTEGKPTASVGDWVVAIAAMLVVAGLLMFLGSRQRNIVAKAAIIGSGVGIYNALLAISAKGMFGLLPTAGLWANPLTYLTVIVTVCAIATTAYAFRSGPITASSPAMISINPIVATIVAMWLFQVEINHTPLDVIGIAVCVAAVNVGIFALSRSRSVHAALG